MTTTQVSDATEEAELQTWSVTSIALSDHEHCVGVSSREVCDSELVDLKLRAPQLDCSGWVQICTRSTSAQDKLVRELSRRCMRVILSASIKLVACGL
eukprot:706816-Hanusia_phi.AAC.1